MCGITGIYNSADPEKDQYNANAMAQAIACRGPDAGNVKTLDNTVFAHRRLAIIDLAQTADQPMTSSCGKCMITFNGEIYNYQTLRKYLQSKGVEFRTHSDTEAILQLYMHGGIDVLPQLDGMFAFAIYDSRSGNLVLMRDALGKKPLYYRILEKNQLHFASTLAALKAHPAWQGKLCNSAIKDFIAYGSIPGNGSVYKDVQQLPPGHVMTFSQNGKRFCRRWWSVDYGKKLDWSFEEASTVLREKVCSAVGKRLIADVPCGLFLSGGIDSAIVSMLAAERSATRLNAFTIGFAENKYDERNLAAHTANWINAHTAHGVEHHTQIVDCQSFDTLKQLASVYGEPFADFSMLPTYFLSKFAASKVKLVLSGDGADEIFGGYERYRAMKLTARLNNVIPRSILRLFSFTADMIFPDHGKRSKISRLCRLLRLAAAPESRRYALLMLQGSDKLRRELAGERLAQVAPDPARYLLQAIEEATSMDKIERFAECDLSNYLVSDILVKVDRASMANSLEVRSPFLDSELVKFAAELPFEFKQQGSQRKRILKDALNFCLSPAVINQRKRGFAVPVGQWFRNEWKQHLQEHLLEGKIIADNWINKSCAEKIIAQHNSCARDHSELLGNLLMLAIFLETK